MFNCKHYHFAEFKFGNVPKFFDCFLYRLSKNLKSKHKILVTIYLQYCRHLI